MSLVVDLDELVTLPQLMERYGVSHNLVHRWSYRPDFPSPVRQVGRSNVYLAGEVDAWHKSYSENKPKGGRPRVEREPKVREPHVFPCPVRECGNKRKLDFRGNVQPFCRKHMDMFAGT